MSVPSLLTQLKAIKRWGKDSQGDYKFLCQPSALIANGDKDMRVPTENSYIDMHEKIKDSKLIIYPNAGSRFDLPICRGFQKELIAFLEV